MKAFRKLKNLFSFATAPVSYPEAISLADCIGCRDAELPRIKSLGVPNFAEEVRELVRSEAARFPVTAQARISASRLIDATSFADPVSHAGPITQYAPEVFVWYDEAGLMGGVEYSLEAAQAERQRYVERFETPSQFVDAPLTLKVAALSEADGGNQYSEQEHFVGEHLLQIGAQVLDDDGAVYAANLATFIKLLQDYQAPLFFTAGVESAAILKWRGDYNEMARKWADGQRTIADLEEALHLETERADNAGRNASAFEERMGQLQVECGRLEDRRHNDNDANDLLIKGLRDRVAHLGGVNKRLRSKVRVARNQRNQVRAKLAELQAAQ